MYASMYTQALARSPLSVESEENGSFSAGKDTKTTKFRVLLAWNTWSPVIRASWNSTIYQWDGKRSEMVDAARGSDAKPRRMQTEFNPLNSQNLNGYSYVLNNPLSGVDPTGYECNPVDRDTAGCVDSTGNIISQPQAAQPGQNGQQGQGVDTADRGPAADQGRPGRPITDCGNGPGCVTLPNTVKRQFKGGESHFDFDFDWSGSAPPERRQDQPRHGGRASLAAPDPGSGQGARWRPDRSHGALGPGGRRQGRARPAHPDPVLASLGRDRTLFRQAGSAQPRGAGRRKRGWSRRNEAQA
jgi:hypothetical protein